MRRFFAVVTIAVVVLAVTVAPAFASVCAGSMCGEVMTSCSPVTSVACPMDAGVPIMHALCTHNADHASHDGVPTQPGPEGGPAPASAIGVVVLPVTIFGGGTSPLTDARGAPHLTSVIRI